MDPAPADAAEPLLPFALFRNFLLISRSRRRADRLFRAELFGDRDEASSWAAWGRGEATDVGVMGVRV